jgi:hypothetical protein
VIALLSSLTTMMEERPLFFLLLSSLLKTVDYLIFDTLLMER